MAMFAMTYRRGARGFTLIEMIVVLAVLGLALVLVVTHGPMRSPRLELDGEARQVAGVLRLARSRAIAEERAVTVAFDTGGYRLDRGAPVGWTNGVSPAGNGVISFTPDGGSSGGVIVLRGGERQVAIGVDWLTGRVVVR
jgi:general secretion pathway protein H